MATRRPLDEDEFRIYELKSDETKVSARSLMKGLLAESRRKALCFLSLEVRSGNAPAIALYSSLGFATVGKRPGYYLRPPEDALIMTKTFAEDKEI